MSVIQSFSSLLSLKNWEGADPPYIPKLYRYFLKCQFLPKNRPLGDKKGAESHRDQLKNFLVLILQGKLNKIFYLNLN